MTSLPAPSMEMTVGRQGHYAGAVSRLLAFGADVGVSWVLYSGGAGLVSVSSELITGRSFHFTHHQILAIVILVLWEGLYFSYPWAVSGKTPEGAPIGARHAITRTLALPLSILVVGLGFVGILFQRERRALHDLLAGTAVVYAWDARAARLRWMARTEKG